MSPRKNYRRKTLEEARLNRAKRNKANGLQEGWASDALDLYLDGYNLTDIATIMSVKAPSVQAAISREALFRLMESHAVERLEDLEELKGK